MANPEYVALLKRSVKDWNEWRENHYWETFDLTGADLSDLDLSGAVFNGADLTEANFQASALKDTFWHSTFLRRTNFGHADLELGHFGQTQIWLSDFSNASLRDTSFDLARIAGSDFSGADMHGTNFRSTHFEKCCFHMAQMSETALLSVNLETVIDLEMVTHRGPSHVDFHTLAMSRDLPEVFLRGVGLPDNVIAYYRSLVGAAIDFYSCFISYSTKDDAFARRFHADLQANGVRCWFAPHDLKAGQKLHEQIDDAIRLHEKLLLILSPNSMNSEWVRTEISKARKRELKENRRVLFPIRLVDFNTLRDWECFDADAGKDSAREIREYYIPDFSKWKSDADEYQREFAKLLKALKSV